MLTVHISGGHHNKKRFVLPEDTSAFFQLIEDTCNFKFSIQKVQFLTLIDFLINHPKASSISFIFNPRFLVLWVNDNKRFVKWIGFKLFFYTGNTCLVGDYTSKIIAEDDIYMYLDRRVFGVR